MIASLLTIVLLKVRRAQFARRDVAAEA